MINRNPPERAHMTQISRKDAIAFAISVTVDELTQLRRQTAAKRAKLNQLLNEAADLNAHKFAPLSFRAAQTEASAVSL